MASKDRPTIKDDDRYEAMRREGMSKEKAARIANSPRHRTAVKGGHAQSYDDWTKQDLMKKAARVGIEGRSRMKKDQLIEALRHH